MATKEIVIRPPRFALATFLIRGIAPLVINKFSKDAIGEIKEKQLAGSQAKKGKKRKARDFKKCFEQAAYISKDGWYGMKTSAFRVALISACRLAGFQMTLAKLAIFIEADGTDLESGVPLVRIIGPKPEISEMIGWIGGQTKTPTIAIRPLWRKWAIELRIKFDEDIFSLEDITNLLMRVGMQVGVGEGRPDSPKSPGMNWGLFEIERKMK
jgi:hypothetical protein